jgi:transcriptional regulator of acetoin/glycerol metabolism
MSDLDEALRDLRAYRETAARRDELIRAAKDAGADLTTNTREAGVSRPTVYEALKTEEAPSPAGGGRGLSPLGANDDRL